MSIEAAAPLTARQNELLALVCQCLKSKPEIDMEKFMTLGGYTNLPSAKSGYHKIMRAVMSGDNAADGDGETATPGKKNRGRKRKGGDGEEAELETPARKKATLKKAKEAPTEDDDDEKADAAVKAELEDGEEV